MSKTPEKRIVAIENRLADLEAEFAKKKPAPKKPIKKTKK